jgi:hypothetical protein
MEPEESLNLPSASGDWEASDVNQSKSPQD